MARKSSSNTSLFDINILEIITIFLSLVMVYFVGMITGYTEGFSSGVRDMEEKAISKGFGEVIQKDRQVVFKWKEIQKN